MTPLDTQELAYSESEISSCSTKDRSESSSNESIILDLQVKTIWPRAIMKTTYIFVGIRA